MPTFEPTPNPAFNAGLVAAIEEVLTVHPMIDWRGKHPWLYSSLGDPEAPVWFIAENPSDKQIRRVLAHDAEQQWAASDSDRLFREALFRNGFKTGTPMSPGGWRCYITNISKAPVVVSEWNGRPPPEKDEQVNWWAPVLNYEMRTGAPQLIVTMGGNARRHFGRFRRNGWVPPEPQSAHVWHYAFRRQNEAGKAEYHRQLMGVATLATALAASTV